MLSGMVGVVATLFLWLTGVLVALALVAGLMYLLGWTVREAIDTLLRRRAARREEDARRATR